jgi:hypothetical protein
LGSSQYLTATAWTVSLKTKNEVGKVDQSRHREQAVKVVKVGKVGKVDQSRHREQVVKVDGSVVNRESPHHVIPHHPVVTRLTQILRRLPLAVLLRPSTPPQRPSTPEHRVWVP